MDVSITTSYHIPQSGPQNHLGGPQESDQILELPGSGKNVPEPEKKATVDPQKMIMDYNRLKNLLYLFTGSDLMLVEESGPRSEFNSVA